MTMKGFLFEDGANNLVLNVQFNIKKGRNRRVHPALQKLIPGTQTTGQTTALRANI